jgi:hypothetical protein
MSQPRKAEPVKLIASLFSSDRQVLSETVKVLSQTFGRVDFISEYLAFDYTAYYADEMGPFLERRIVAFEELVRPEALPGIKLATNVVEEQFSKDGKRRVNVDPGYVAKGHMILATGKGYAHRPYLGDGIFADLTLIYRKGSFQPLEWTYPDYREEMIIDLMNKIRMKYLFQLKGC